LKLEIPEPISKADETRNELRIGQYDSVNIFKILRDREKISLIITKMTENISGFFIRKDDIGLIVINSTKSLGHQYFTAAHEFYHIRYDKGMSGKICPINKYDDDYQNERDANLFASHFLMPDTALKYMIMKKTGGKKISINDIIFLENYFQVSHKVMLIRLKLLEVITDAEAQKMENGIIKNALLLGYSTDLYKNTVDKGTVILSEYAELAKELLDNQKISYGKYEELLMDGGYENIVFGDNENLKDVEDKFEDSYSF
jgi:Zn-dependent peptidase ImmA (M78 family)